MGTFFERRHLTEPHFVQDATGLLLAEIVDPRALILGERAQRRCREVGGETEAPADS
jgi:hypothetical protein